MRRTETKEESIFGGRDGEEDSEEGEGEEEEEEEM